MRYLQSAVFCLALLVAACGGGDDDDAASGGPGGSQTADDTAIRKVLGDFVNAMNSDNSGKVVSLMDADSRKGCDEKDIKQLIGLLKAFSGNKKFGLDVRQVKVEGQDATVLAAASVGSEKQDPEERRLVKESSGWKLVFSPDDCSI
jgi:ketosteroid isomerase-like protein